MSPEHALSLAVEAGALATCQKSLRGVVIFHPHNPRRIAAVNGPPGPFTCNGSTACRTACNQVAVHAEGLVAYPAERFHELSLAHHGLPTTRRA